VKGVLQNQPLPYWEGYINFSAWFVKNAVFENKRMKF